MEIEIRNLCKTYGTKLVLDNICMNIPEGMYGLLGENGSGKTTLMRILATVLEPSSGSLRIDGTDLRMKHKIRQVIGYLPQDFSVYPSMRVEAAMDYLGVLSTRTYRETGPVHLHYRKGQSCFKPISLQTHN